MIKEGTGVQWSWGKGMTKGEVVETYTTTVTKKIKGTEVTRNGEQGDKALFIKQEDGPYMLKGESEVERCPD